MSERQQIYDQIRALGSRDKLILQEMIRKGFWKPGTGQTEISEEFLEREAKLTSELRSLYAKQQVYEDRDKALAAMRKERLRKSRERRQEKKLEREQISEAKKEAWQKRKAEEILYLGDESSGALSDLTSESERLVKWGLPNFSTHRDLAQAMEISVGELRFLSYGRKVSKLGHYRRFLMPKKRGGHRLISAPMPRLKAAQHWLLENILTPIPLHEAAHGFRPEHSILTNAAPHCGAQTVINLDLKDFFPNITWPRVFGLFRALGYSRSISLIFTQLCTEPPVENLELDGETWQVATGKRHLPQGAPTSPAITNLLCRRLDARMAGIARKHHFTYTRYADDLTFSTKGNTRSDGRKLLWQVQKVIHEEGFTIHPDKLRLMDRGRRQEVTGLTVHEETPTVPRQDVRAFRALLHQLENKGPENCHWRGDRKRTLAKVNGFANYLNMIDAERYQKLITQARTILRHHRFEPEIRHPKKQAPVPPPLPGSDESPLKKEKKSGFWKRLFGKK